MKLIKFYFSIWLVSKILRRDIFFMRATATRLFKMSKIFVTKEKLCNTITWMKGLSLIYSFWKVRCQITFDNKLRTNGEISFFGFIKTQLQRFNSNIEAHVQILYSISGAVLQINSPQKFNPKMESLVNLSSKSDQILLDFCGSDFDTNFIFFSLLNS